MSEKPIVELADVIKGLRGEIKRAQQQADGEDIRFGINHINVELDVSIMKQHKITEEINAGVDSGDSLLKYFVGKIKGDIKIGGEHTFQKVATQKITINLSAEDSEGKKISVSNINKKKK